MTRIDRPMRGEASYDEFGNLDVTFEAVRGCHEYRVVFLRDGRVRLAAHQPDNVREAAVAMLDVEREAA